MPESELHGTGGEIRTVKGKAKYIAVAAVLAAAVAAASLFTYYRYGVADPFAVVNGYVGVAYFKRPAVQIEGAPDFVYAAPAKAGKKELEDYFKQNGRTLRSDENGYIFSSGGKTYRVTVLNGKLFELWKVRAE